MKLRKSLIFYSLIIISLSFSCKSTKTHKLGERKKPPLGPIYNCDSLGYDTVFVMREHFCFPHQNYCLDTNIVNIIFYNKHNKSLETIKCPFSIINDTTINIFPVDISSAKDSTIIAQTMRMLKIINVIKERNKILNLRKQKSDPVIKVFDFDSIPVSTKYFFDFSKSNTATASDTIDYTYVHSDGVRAKVKVIVDLELKITGDEVLTRLMMDEKIEKHDDYATRILTTKNKYCKKIFIKIKFTVKDKILSYYIHSIPDYSDLIGFEIWYDD